VDEWLPMATPRTARCLFRPEATVLGVAAGLLLRFLRSGCASAELEVKPWLPGLAAIVGALGGFTDGRAFRLPDAAHLGRMGARLRASENHRAGMQIAFDYDDLCSAADPVLMPNMLRLIPGAETLAFRAVDAVILFAQSTAAENTLDKHMRIFAAIVSVENIPVTDPEIEAVIRRCRAGRGGDGCGILGVQLGRETAGEENAPRAPEKSVHPQDGPHWRARQQVKNAARSSGSHKSICSKRGGNEWCLRSGLFAVRYRFAERRP
jgi:hypothetical protein